MSPGDGFRGATACPEVIDLVASELSFMSVEQMFLGGRDGGQMSPNMGY